MHTSKVRKALPMICAHAKQSLGYDVVYVDDIAASTSPEYAIEMVRYNGDIDGFVSNSTMILPALPGGS